MAKILTYPGDYKAFKAIIAAHYAGVEVTTPAKGEFEIGTHDKTPEFLKKSPLGRIPVLETKDGEVLLESNAIARYFARMGDAKLLGSSFWEQAQVDQWVDWCSEELEIPATLWLFPVLGLALANNNAIQKGKKDIQESLKVLNDYLADKTYIVGNSVTLADIVVVATLHYPMKVLFSWRFRAQFPHVVRHFLHCSSLPEFQKVVGEIDLCVFEQKAKIPKKKKQQKKKGGEEKKKPEKKKKEKKKKPKKNKHPLDMLAKASVHIDDWKRRYSNSPTEKAYYESFDWMIATLDFKNDYSLWLAEHKHQEENKLDYQVSNACAGFVQRSEGVRKWCFGVMGALDSEAYDGKYFPRYGGFLIRGQSIQPLIDTNPEGELYNWKKVEMDDKETQRKIADLWCSWDKAEAFGPGNKINSNQHCFK